MNMGTFVMTLYFPRELFRINNIASKLANFQFFRADVRVSIRLNGTQFSYGKLLVAYLPHYVHHDLIPQRDRKMWSLPAASCCPHVIVSANTNVSEEFVIPYVTPTQFVDLSWKNADRYFGIVRVFILNPLNSSNSAEVSPLHVAIFANFENIHVAGPTIHSYIQKQVGERDEAERKTQRQSIAGNFSSIVQVARDFCSLGVIRPIISRWLGFSKPINVEPLRNVQLDLSRDMSFGEGLDYSNRLSLYPDYQIATDSCSIFRTDKDEMDMAYILGTPFLFQIVTVQAGLSQGTIVAKFPVVPTIGYYYKEISYFSHIAWYSQFFRFWRGSIKYCVMITAGSFTSGRIRVSWHPNLIDIPKQLNDGSGDYVSHVVDITGDTRFNFSIPYLQAVPWLPLEPLSSRSEYDSRSANGVIVVSIVNSFRTTTNINANPVYLNFWIGAGQNFQFGKFGAITRQYGMREVFEKEAFPALIEGEEMLDNNLCMGESYPSLRVLMKRYASKGCFRLLKTCFLFKRGSRRWKGVYFRQSPQSWKEDEQYVQVSSVVAGAEIQYENNLYQDGITFTNIFYKPSLEVEIPYYSNVYFQYNVSNNLLYRYPRAHPVWSRQPNVIMKSAGDDYIVGWLCNPDAIVFGKKDEVDQNTPDLSTMGQYFFE